MSGADETQVVIEVPQAAYDAGEAALSPYSVASISGVDRVAAARDVIHAAFPVALAAAYTDLADELTELAESMRIEGSLADFRVIESQIKAAGLVEGITVIRERAARLRGDAR